MTKAYFRRMKIKEPTVDFEKSIGPWLGRTMKIVDYYLQDVMQNADLDLSKEQMIILKKLIEQDGLTQNELAKLTYRDKSSLARLLFKMEQKNYIRREPSKTDKRVNQVFLTPQGLQIFDNARPHVAKLIERMEHTITESEKQQMITILKKVQTNLS